MSIRYKVKSAGQALSRIYAAQGRQLTRADHERLANAYEADTALERIEELKQDFYEDLSDAERAELAALSTEVGKLAMAGRSTADGSVQLRAVNRQVEPTYVQPSPEQKAHKRQVEEAAQRRYAAEQEQRQLERRAAWKVEREKIIERQHNFRRDLLLNGGPNVTSAYLVPPSINPPSWWMVTDGEVRYSTLRSTVQRNEDGTQTIDFDRDPITGRRFDEPAPAKTPEQQFQEA